MKRDASPQRTKLRTETEETLFCVSTQSQWLLIYFAVLLECDVPILEALLFTKGIDLSPKGDNFQDRLYQAIWRHLRGMQPDWSQTAGTVSERLMWASDRHDPRWFHLQKKEMQQIVIEVRGAFELRLDLTIMIQTGRIVIFDMGGLFIPTRGEFFSTLQTCIERLIQVKPPHLV